MSTVSVRELSHNPSAVLARVERGETIEVTRHGKVIAAMVPRAPGLDRYADLVAKGVVRMGRLTTSDLDQLTRYDVPDDVDPLALLIAERESYER